MSIRERGCGPQTVSTSGSATDTAKTAAGIDGPGGARVETRRLSSTQLLGGLDEVEIQHGGFVYRLRQTSLGKLILTK